MFYWSKDLECGVADIDKQHQELFRLARELYYEIKDLTEVDHYDEIINALDALKKYTLYHFETEEMIMDESNYPKTMSHKMQHKKFIQAIQDIEAKNIDNLEENQVKVIEDILILLAEWIQNHILNTDMKLAEFELDNSK